MGISTDDTEAVAERMASKVAKMRIFEDAEGKTLWKSTVKQAEGQILSGMCLPFVYETIFVYTDQ